jgi:hypothetical protein
LHAFDVLGSEEQQEGRVGGDGSVFLLTRDNTLGNDTEKTTLTNSGEYSAEHPAAEEQ